MNNKAIIEIRLSQDMKNRPFPSSLVPLFQSESKCKTILMKKLRAELIFI